MSGIDFDKGILRAFYAIADDLVFWGIITDDEMAAIRDIIKGVTVRLDEREAANRR